MSSSELGGGALLDESHWLDQMIWLFGMPDRVFGTVAKISDLEITSDDSVDLLCFYRNGMNVSIHMDIYGRPHEKSILVLGTEGNLIWDEKSNSVTTHHKNGIEETNTFANSRNDMFVGVAAEFVDVMAGAQPTTCQIEDGIKVLQIIEGVRTSSRLKKVVDLADLV
jgi:predicted dehydrogenase